MKVYMAPLFKTDKARLLLQSLRYGAPNSSAPVLDYNNAGRWFAITGDPASVEEATTTLVAIVGGSVLL